MKYLIPALFCSLLICFCLAAGQVQSNIKSAVVETYARLVYLNYVDAYQQAIQLKWSIDDFLSDPSGESLEKAKKYCTDQIKKSISK